MDTIFNYLDNMFLSLPKTKEMERAKQELANMMEDKYNELRAEGKTDNEAVGIVISEFGNLKELAEELGISDLMDGKTSEPAKKVLGDDEVKNYIYDNQKASKQIAIGAMLCIFSPIPLILLAGMQEKYKSINDVIVNGVGVCTLLAIIAIAVGIFIYTGMSMEKYESLKKEPFAISNASIRYVEAYRDQMQQTFSLKIIVGVVMCILSIIPVVIVGSIEDNNDFGNSIAVSFLLFVVGIAVILFVTGGMQKEVTKILLQEGDYSFKSEEGSKVIDIISGIYWPIVVCIYLAWSFISHDWGFTWIVWPIAGVLFGGISATCSALCKKN